MWVKVHEIKESQGYKRWKIRRESNMLKNPLCAICLCVPVCVCAPEHWISGRSGDFQLGQPDQCRCAGVAAHLDSRLQTATAGGALRQAKEGATIICRQMLARHIGRFIERRNGRRNTTRPTARAAVHRFGDAGDTLVAVLPTPSFCVTDNEYTSTLCISLMHLPHASPSCISLAVHLATTFDELDGFHFHPLVQGFFF